MAACAVIVEFRLKPGAWAQFITIMAEHARLTRAEEPGCKEFAVLHDDNDPERALLVEMFEDRHALELHRAGSRMPAVTAALAPLTLERTRTCATVVT